MIAVIQRVQEASVSVEGEAVSRIGKGILTLLGVENGDTEEQLARMIDKIIGLRVFEDQTGKMNLSLKDIQGEHLLVSQFTLAGDCNSGRRPSFTTAEKPPRAKELYDKGIDLSREAGIVTYGGVFQADMKVSLTNDGPVTFVLRT